MAKQSRPSSQSLLDSLEIAPQLPLGNAEELISQLAGDDIDRLLGPEDHWHPEESPRPSSLVTKQEKSDSVEELTAQLDEVFEQIRRQELTPPAPIIDMTEPEPITLPEPVLAMRRTDEAEASEIQSRRSLLDPLDTQPLPKILRPIAWFNAPVAQLSGGAKFAVSAVSILSLVGSVAALVYVLVLRQGI